MQYTSVVSVLKSIGNLKKITSLVRFSLKKHCKENKNELIEALLWTVATSRANAIILKHSDNSRRSVGALSASFLAGPGFGEIVDHSPPALFFLKWRLARTHEFHSLGQDQWTVA